MPAIYGGDGNDGMTGDSVGASPSGGGNDHLRGGDGIDTMIGDSNAFTGDAAGAATTCSMAVPAAT